MPVAEHEIPVAQVAADDMILDIGPDTAERLAAAMAQVTDRDGETVPRSGSEQGTLEVGKAMKAH